MKQKRTNRVLAALLAAAMMFQMLPMLAFAAEGDGTDSTGSEVSVDSNESLKAAVQAAPADGTTTTITLGAGEYTLYGTELTAGKNLTFVGQGIDVTTWKIGTPDADTGSQDNADFSFKGSKTITFQNMTLETDHNYNYQGFAHTTDTVVKNCEINGMTAFWGYTSATFTNVTFNAPGSAKVSASKEDYAIWAYSSAEMTFEKCTFNTNGKAIKVYNEGGTDITVKFEDCTVTTREKYNKPAINIDDRFSNFTVEISGNNTVDTKREDATCSRLFGFGGNSHGKTTVKIDNDTVWQNGNMVSHKHSEGEKQPDAFTMVEGYPTDWVAATDDSNREMRTVKKKCTYCGWEETTTEYRYTISYNLDGGTGAADENYGSAPREDTMTFAAAPRRAGYWFKGWKIFDKDGNPVSETLYQPDEKLSKANALLQNGATITAVWEVDPTGGDPSEDVGSGAGGDGGAGVVVAGALLGGAGYLLGTRLWLENTFGFVPANRIELATALWKRADCPEPVSTELYPDIDEDDTDAQKAARWCVEQDLMKEFTRTEADGTETVKFKPYDYVFRPESLVRWYQLEKLLNEQKNANA